MNGDFFSAVGGRITFAGLDSTDPLTFKVYDPNRMVLGKRMEDQLRIGVCLWHSFNWPGSDVFGVGTFDRPWLAPGQDPLTAAETKLDAAFEFIAKLGVADQRADRYRGWSAELGRSILAGEASFDDLERRVAAGELDPRPVSGGQELLENMVNQRIWAADRVAT
ncbi:MAG: hypothetical protein LC797_17100 [Chloroflexi bacterium]|nr:hypothetical protein [Chloroflexota bacterium]